MHFTNKLVEEFLDSVYVRSHSNESVKTYRNGLRKFEEFLKIKHQICIIEIIKKIKDGENDVYQILRDFVVYQDKMEFMPRTIDLAINAVKGYLRHHGIRIYSEDFKQVVRMPKKMKIQEIPLTKEILLRVLRNVTPKLQTVILVAISSGMRIGEITQLTIDDIDFDSNPTRIRIRGETTKTRTARETFLTTEATTTLKDYLKRYHNWNEGQQNHHVKNKAIFGRTSISKKIYKQEHQLKTSPELAVKTLLQKSLERGIKKIPELNIKNENGVRVIHFHAFRKFFRTTVGNEVGRDFAEAIMGHSFYLDTYYQLSNEKKCELYLKAEPHLTISDFQNVEKTLKTFSGKYEELENKIKDLTHYLKFNGIEIPN